MSADKDGRLGELEAKGELAPVERGELRAMAHGRLAPDERDRVERLLSPAPAQDGASEAYERGLQRGRAAGRPS